VSGEKIRRRRLEIRIWGGRIVGKKEDKEVRRLDEEDWRRED
jgi:hypothetical protein